MITYGLDQIYLHYFFLDIVKNLNICLAKISITSPDHASETRRWNATLFSAQKGKWPRLLR